MELTNSDMISWWVADVKLFPSVCCLWDWRARGDHVQQVLPLAGVDGGWRLVTRQAGVHVGHGDSCEHAADEQVRVWNRLQAIVMLLSKVNSEKKRCYDSESTWVYHFSSSQNKEIVVEGEKLWIIEVKPREKHEPPTEKLQDYWDILRLKPLSHMYSWQYQEKSLQGAV